MPSAPPRRPLLCSRLSLVLCNQLLLDCTAVIFRPVSFLIPFYLASVNNNDNNNGSPGQERRTSLVRCLRQPEAAAKQRAQASSSSTILCELHLGIVIEPECFRPQTSSPKSSRQASSLILFQPSL